VDKLFDPRFFFLISPPSDGFEGFKTFSLLSPPFPEENQVLPTGLFFSISLLGLFFEATSGLLRTPTEF